MFAPYKLPNQLNPDYMRGFEDGYKACQVDVHRKVDLLKPFTTETSTVSTGGPNDE